MGVLFQNLFTTSQHHSAPGRTQSTCCHADKLSKPHGAHGPQPHGPQPHGPGATCKANNSPLVVLLLRRRLLNLGRRRLLLLRCRLVLLQCLAPSQLLSVPMLQVEEWQPTFTADAIATDFPGGGGSHDEAGGSHEQNALELKRCATCTEYMLFKPRRNQRGGKWQSRPTYLALTLNLHTHQTHGSSETTLLYQKRFRQGGASGKCEPKACPYCFSQHCGGNLQVHVTRIHASDPNCLTMCHKGFCDIDQAAALC